MITITTLKCHTGQKTAYCYRSCKIIHTARQHQTLNAKVYHYTPFEVVQTSTVAPSVHLSAARSLTTQPRLPSGPAVPLVIPSLALHWHSRVLHTLYTVGIFTTQLTTDQTKSRSPTMHSQFLFNQPTFSTILGYSGPLLATKPCSITLTPHCVDQ